MRAMPREIWIILAGTFLNRFGSFVMPFLAIYLTQQGYSVARAGIAMSRSPAKIGELLLSVLKG